MIRMAALLLAPTLLGLACNLASNPPAALPTVTVLTDSAATASVEAIPRVIAAASGTPTPTSTPRPSATPTPTLSPSPSLQPTPFQGWGGAWNLSFFHAPATMFVYQSGLEISGGVTARYRVDFNGTTSEDGRIVRGTWREVGNRPLQGTFVWKLEDNERQFLGSLYVEVHNYQPPWCGMRDGLPAPPPCWFAEQ